MYANISLQTDIGTKVDFKCNNFNVYVQCQKDRKGSGTARASRGKREAWTARLGRARGTSRAGRAGIF